MNENTRIIPPITSFPIPCASIRFIKPCYLGSLSDIFQIELLFVSYSARVNPFWLTKRSIYWSSDLRITINTLNKHNERTQ